MLRHTVPVHFEPLHTFQVVWFIIDRQLIAPGCAGICCCVTAGGLAPWKKLPGRNGQSGIVPCLSGLIPLKSFMDSAVDQSIRSVMGIDTLNPSNQQYSNH